MKSSRQQKRKITEITRKQDDCLGVSVKRSTNETGRGLLKSTESVQMGQLGPQVELQVLSAKIKLQLFPMTEHTRLGLEKDGFNPFLELTLSARKKISSVARHLNTKWGSSRVAKGQLMLFPYNTKLEQVASSRRWTLNDSAITAGEVYVVVGCPSLFRLRYGWDSNLQQEMFDIPPRSTIEINIDSRGMESSHKILEIPCHQDEKINEAREALQKQIDVNEMLLSNAQQPRALDVPTNLVDDEVAPDVGPVLSTIPWDDNLTNLSIGGLLSEISLQGKINGCDLNSVNRSGLQPIGLISDISIGGLLSETSLFGKLSNPNMKPENDSSLQPFVLPSSDISIGGLLSEASLHSNMNKFDARTTEGSDAQIQTSWDDNLTTLSIGGLLSEASLQAEAGCNMGVKECKSRLQSIAPSSDSFDSLIFSQLNAHSNALKPTCRESNLSILDAEETCHAFPAQKFQASRDVKTPNTKVGSIGCTNDASVKKFPFSKMNNEQEVKMNPFPSSLRDFDR